MSKTWEVFAQSSEPEAHVKKARQTKDTKQIENDKDILFNASFNDMLKKNQVHRSLKDNVQSHGSYNPSGMALAKRMPPRSSAFRA